MVQSLDAIKEAAWALLRSGTLGECGLSSLADFGEAIAKAARDACAEREWDNAAKRRQQLREAALEAEREACEKRLAAQALCDAERLQAEEEAR